jgi:zinc protease
MKSKISKVGLRAQSILACAMYCLLLTSTLDAKGPQSEVTMELEEIEIMKNTVQKDTTAITRPVIKKQLANGMTILIYPTHTIPSVSVQIWYKVGSKDENNGEKGIAHLIEHMIFKGTTGKGSLGLSESDINTITHMLSGSCNAFTAQDYTGYLFNLPTHHWKMALPIMADCMLNCTFSDEHLNSEMKAVIQELKMRRDNYGLSLAEALLSAVFIDHPYHYPIIGFKQDLWNVRGKDLLKFYKKHYAPNNATLVVVGDVNPDEVIKLAQQYFGHLKPDTSYKRPEFFHTKDIIAKSVTLYRDVQQPLVLAAFVVPGLSSKNKPILDITSWILGAGKGSRLYRKLVDETCLATSLSTFYWDLLFDHSLFFIAFEPKKVEDVNTILTLINQEIHDIVTNGLQQQELVRAVNKARMSYYELLEENEQQAYEMGKYFLATGDENYIFNYLQEDYATLQKEVVQLLAQNFRPSVMHVGKVLPLPASEKQAWAQLQKESDQEDFRILSARIRTQEVEPPQYAQHVAIKQPVAFAFPKADKAMLSNGIKLLYYNNPSTPKINLELRFKAKDYYEPQKCQGLYTFMTSMMLEGTQKHTAAQLAQELESRGMSLRVFPGGVSMSMLSADFEKGLELLLEVLTQATFNDAEIEKVRVQLLADLKNFWDDPSAFSGQLIKEVIYREHPYSKNNRGTQETITAIQREDLVDLYTKFITPAGATLAIVGDLKGYNVPAVVQKVLGAWQGQDVETITFPALQPAQAREINYPINRDQVVLCFAAPSIARKHPDFDKLFIFDQILGGGVLNSMSSRLFELREQTGLFYGIAGSLIAQSNEQPGMVMVKTKVSLDRLQEAEKVIKDTLAHVADTITQDEFDHAKNAILNSLTQNFETNASTASAFLYLDKFGFADDFYDKRAQDLARITIPEVQAAVKRALQTDKLATFRIGRIEK